MKVKLNLNSMTPEQKIELLLKRCGVDGVRAFVAYLAEHDPVGTNIDLEWVIEKLNADEIDYDLSA